MQNVPSCKKHGTEFIQFKCRFCCSLSTWHCWGKTHFCSKCHSGIWGKLVEYSSGKNKLKMPGEGKRRNHNKEYVSAHFTGDDAIDEYISCPGIAAGDSSCCPLKILHDPNGVEFGMGCAMCARDEE